MAAPSGLPTVRPPQEYNAFNDFRAIYHWAIVDKLTLKGEKQERVLILTASHLFLADVSGKIYRAAKISDIEKVAVQDRQAQVPALAIKFSRASFEPTVLLQLRRDHRNPPQCSTVQQLLGTLNSLRRPQCGEELQVQEFPPGQLMHKAPELGPWEKPPGYMTPKDKAKRLESDPASVVTPVRRPSDPAGGVGGGGGDGFAVDLNTEFPQGALVAVTGHNERATVAGHDPPSGVIVTFPGSAQRQRFDAAKVRRVELEERVVIVHLNSQQDQLGIDFDAPAGSGRVHIEGIVPGGAAHRAGLPSGHDILAVDGTPVRSGHDLVSAVAAAQKQAKESGGGGQQVAFTITPSQAQARDADAWQDHADYDDYEEEFDEEPPEEWTPEQEEELQVIEQQLMHTRIALKRAQDRIVELRNERDTAVTQQYRERERAQQREQRLQRKKERARQPARLLERELGKLWLANFQHPRRRRKWEAKIRGSRRDELPPAAAGYDGCDPLAGVLLRHLTDVRVGLCRADRL
eukprot:TRINITY_DN5110_c0_g1_i1.p1 TRINITY_DN5110_c0_g1~~TRINITY_DN5110_c0_g1_i1.p1  ORF type:complete len:544 (+),score=172.25 TRINITY_DN5110_c0_g1_i1:77-1633(+)